MDAPSVLLKAPLIIFSRQLSLLEQLWLRETPMPLSYYKGHRKEQRFRATLLFSLGLVSRNHLSVSSLGSSYSLPSGVAVCVGGGHWGRCVVCGDPALTPSVGPRSVLC